jgi:predicted TIM-barrel fold metal-dependent hydrolase
MNIAVAWGDEAQWRDHSDRYRDLSLHRPDRYAWCATIPPPPETEEGRKGWLERSISELDRHFEQGALACKFHKGIGMGVRTPAGRFLMVDDPVLDPIFDYLTQRQKPALLHIGEPIAAWMPITPGFPHSDYFARRPQFHWHGQTDKPTHSDLIAARDRRVARHPALRFIGAHLGSQEHDVEEVSRRLDLYPNYAVDVSARLIDLFWQEQAKVREFFLRHQDRVLFGVDWIIESPLSLMDEERRRGALRALKERYTAYMKYFETDEEVEFQGRVSKGLKLPAEVLQKLYVDNARAWLPGI